MDTQFSSQAEDLRQRIESTKADLSENLRVLEASLDTGVEEAADAVAALIEKGFGRVSDGFVRGVDRFCDDLQASSIVVRDTVQRSLDELASSFDLKQTARRHPVATFTLTALLGLTVSEVLRRRLN